MAIEANIVEDKKSALTEDLEKVTAELDKLSQLRLKILGALEILDSLEESEDKEEIKDADDDSN